MDADGNLGSFSLSPRSRVCEADASKDVDPDLAALGVDSVIHKNFTLVEESL